jgi:two-component system phosphate regulon response regulator PhoB
MSAKTVLAVEDEQDIMELIIYHLRKEGLMVKTAATGEDALVAARAESPDLILLDLMLPGVDGLEVCRRLKADRALRRIPIIMVTAKGEESDVVSGLELGAEDYVTKPFRPRELLARVRAVLRRSHSGEVEPASGDIVRVHDLEIDPGKWELRVRGRLVDLTYTEFEILYLMARRPGWVFTRYQLVDGVRGSNYPVTDRSVDVQIVGLRRKLGRADRYIETVRGVGYRFRDKLA